MDTDMQRRLRVLVFGASLRENSLNDRLASLATRAVERKGAVVDRGRMRDFDAPSYDEDVETREAYPRGVEDFRRRLLEADAFVVCSPEYNASMPGGLKNLIDWASRFRPQPFRRKHGLLMSASPSMVGGNRGLWALRVPLEHLGANVYPDMFSLAQAHAAFDARGEIASEVLRERFDDTVACFLELVEAAKHYPKIRTRWVEFLGERPDVTIDRVEEAELPA